VETNIDEDRRKWTIFFVNLRPFVYFRQQIGYNTYKSRYNFIFARLQYDKHSSKPTEKTPLLTLSITARTTLTKEMKQ